MIAVADARGRVFILNVIHNRFKQLDLGQRSAVTALAFGTRKKHDLYVALENRKVRALPVRVLDRP